VVKVSQVNFRNQRVRTKMLTRSAAPSWYPSHTKTGNLSEITRSVFNLDKVRTVRYANVLTNRPRLRELSRSSEKCDWTRPRERE
jgi:hypothetical protein